MELPLPERIMHLAEEVEGVVEAGLAEEPPAKQKPQAITRKEDRRKREVAFLRFKRDGKMTTKPRSETIIEKIEQQRRQQVV